MSWALEEWKEGLPTRALQKIQELEGQLDKLKKERQQRQFQLETLEAALQKQKQKVENEKSEGINLKRENQSLMEICENLEKMKQKISHDLQVKESQVNFQEGQLTSSKKQIEKLEQELKRYKSELERSQQATHSGDVSLNPCNTPQKMFTTPLTPSQYYSGSKYEELKEKYNKEVEERKRLEAEVKVLQANRVSQPVPQSATSHRDIARQQASSSVFWWQQESTPSRLSSSARKTPGRRDFCASHLSGEYEATPSRSAMQTGKRDANSSFCDNSSSSQLLDQLKAQNQELRSKIQELELRLQGQEKELKGQGNKFQELQLQLEKAKMELSEKEKALNKSRDELVRTTAQYDQASTKCTALEQKLKKLSEDLSCQRQNAESARCSLEQRAKEKEKEFQEELSRQQRALQSLEQEGTQVKTKLTQELQQARSAQAVLQAELDRVTAVRHQLEKSLEEFRHKFCRTEEALQVSQTKEDELRRSIEELKKEGGLVRSQSEQQAREVGHLKEELRAAREGLSQSQRLAEDMKAKNVCQETMLRDLQEKISQQENSLTLEKLKFAVADLEKQRDCSQDLLKKREHHIEQLNEKLSKAEQEAAAVLSALELRSRECEDLRQEKTQFSHWKSENEQRLHQMELERESLHSQISHLETCLKTQQIKSQEYSERVTVLELERGQLGAEAGKLQEALDHKASEVEALQQQSASADQKHRKEMENMSWKVAQLTGQVEDLEHKLQVLSGEIVDRDQRFHDLNAECERLQALVKSRGPSLVVGGAHDGSFLTLDQQSGTYNSFADIVGCQENLPSERSDAAQGLPDSAVLQNRVIALESSLESQRQMNSDLQKHCEELVQMRGEIEENLTKAEQMHQDFVAETSQRIHKLQEDTSVHQNVVVETLGALEDKDKELLLLNEQLKAQQAEIQEIKGRNHLLDSSLKELQLLTETLSLEKKEMNSVISLHKKEIQELTQENRRLQEMTASLNQEKISLLQKSESFSLCITEKEESISELSNQYEQERLTLVQQCEETTRAFEALSEKYAAAQAKNSQLELLLGKCTHVCETRKMELEELRDASTREHQACVMECTLAEGRNQHLPLQLDKTWWDLQPEAEGLCSRSQREGSGLKPETVTLKEEQSELQKEVHDLSQENKHLPALVQTQHGHPDSELRPVEAREGEADECDVAHVQMDLEAEDTYLDSHTEQSGQLEAKIRNLELRLLESEAEKECLRQLSETMKESETRVPQQDTWSAETRALPDCDSDSDGVCTASPGTLAADGDDSVHLQSHLRTALSKLTELEEMCASLKVEKLELLSKLNDSRSECITATSKMAEEVEKMVSEVKTLKHENSLLHCELVTEMPGATLGTEHTSLSPDSLDDSSFVDCLTLSNKAVQTHFAELQAKFSCLQSEHRVLHDQHCQMSSKMAALQAYVDMLKAGNSALRDVQDDLMREVTPGPRQGLLSSSFSSVTDSPGLKSLGETSFYKDLEQTGESSLLSHSDGDDMANQSGVQELLVLGGASPSPRGRVQELETLCQVYLQSLKQLEEKMESQNLVRNKEIQELQQLLGSERMELEGLRREYLSEKEQWQQRLTTVTLEMESQLAAEKKQTEHLFLELEAARMQLQSLDLSSRSLLGADLDDATRGESESCDIKEPEGNLPETKGRPSEHDTNWVREDHQDLPPQAVNVSLPTAPRLSGDGSDMHSPGGRALCHSECGSNLPCLGAGPSVPLDCLESRVTIENLQAQVQEMARENTSLLHTIEERDRRVEGLLNEMTELDSKLKLQGIQLATKIAVCLELEKMTEQLKKEKSDLSEKLDSFALDNQELHQIVESLEDLDSSSEMGTKKSSREVTEEDATPVHTGWRERFLAVEQELKKMTAQHSVLERQSLSLGADLERVQTEKLSLEEDTANKQKVIAHLEEELSVVTRERDQLREDLDAWSKESEDLDLPSEETKDISLGRDSQGEPGSASDMTPAVCDPPLPGQLPSSEVGELSGEEMVLPEQLQSLEKDAQVQSVGQGELERQLGQLAQEREWLVRESTSLQAQLSQLAEEKLRVSQALEASQLEKAEVAVRLSSTQEEARQLRKGIEALRVRIETDQQRQRSVADQLRDSERRGDALQDRVEHLERELQLAEESQEMVIIEAEGAKAEAEALRTQAEELAGHLQGVQEDLAAVKSDNENLEKQIQELQGHVSESDLSLSSLKRLLEEKEQEHVQISEESRAAVEALRSQLTELQIDVAALCRGPDTPEAGLPSLASPAEAHPPRAGIQQLRARLRADEEQRLQALGKLEESERQAGLLREQVLDLQRELETVGQDCEQVTREAQDARVQAETLAAKVEDMAQTLGVLESELVKRKAEKEELSAELQKERGRVCELEALNASFENLLQEKEEEKQQIKEDSRSAADTLQTQLKELQERLAASCLEQEACRAREQDLCLRLDALEHEKTQLLRGLGEAERGHKALQSSMNGLLEEMGESKQKLERKEEEIRLLKVQIQDHEQLVSELSQVEGERQHWQEREQELVAQVEELGQGTQTLRTQNVALQDALDELRTSRQDLEQELELSKLENSRLLEKVSSLEVKEMRLQKEVHELTQKAMESKDEFSREKSRLTAALTLKLEELKNSHGQLQELLQENSELKVRLDAEHQEQLEREGSARAEVAAWERRLQEADQERQDLLNAHGQCEVAIQTYQERLASAEERLSTQQAELERLTASGEELGRSLKAATQATEELEKTKVDSLKYVSQLKKENERAQGKIRLLIKSCKQLEEEKETLQKELAQHDTAQETRRAGAAVDVNVEELVTEVKELKETLEAKGKEADEYLDRYCALLISHEKLEQAKEMLETQVARLLSQPSRRRPQSPLPCGAAPGPSPSPPLVQEKLSSAHSKVSAKRQRSSGIRESGGTTTPSTPETFSKKSRKAVHCDSQPTEDMFVPEGLPEVVKKGFADIPTGKTSPYILRRTNLATRTSPRLAAQKLASSPLSLNKENLAEPSRPPAEGTRSQKIKVTRGSPVEPDAGPRSAAGSPLGDLRTKRGQPAPCPEAGSEAQSGENCKVQ